MCATKSGRLTVRIAQQRNTKKYKSESDSFRYLIRDLIPEVGFREVSLSSAKDYLWDEKDRLDDEVRFTTATLKNDYGTSLQAATGSISDDLYKDVGAVEGLTVFKDHDAHCDTSNLWFIVKDPAPPSINIHVYISGEINEFEITGI